MKNREKIVSMTQIALLCALLCVLCPLSVPIGPVPVSLGVFAVYLVAFLLPPLQAVLCCVLYLILGCAGVPVFAGYTAGLPRLLGPTGGYLAGYLFQAFLTALSVRRAAKIAPEEEADKDHADGTAMQGGPAAVHLRRAGVQTLGMLAGLLVLYVFGTAWFLVYAEGVTLSYALAACVWPFLPFDFLKIVCALIAGNALRAALIRAHLIVPA